MLSPLEKLEHAFLSERQVEVWIKRDDLIHPIISGNKYRKLIYLLKKLKNDGVKRVLTFGGAYSNHIHASAYAFKKFGFESIGVIRGDELKNKPLNKTLRFAKENGMQLDFVSRSEYKKRNDLDYLKWLSKKYNAYIIPGGGTTYCSKFGLIDMVKEINQQINHFDYIVCASGTGGTFAGICAGLNGFEKAVAIPVLKGIADDVRKKVESFSDFKNFKIIEGYEFGGYGKKSDLLMDFIDNFYSDFGIQLEQVYTGKMMYALFDLIKNNHFKSGSRIIAVHTGGLQGLLKKDIV